MLGQPVYPGDPVMVGALEQVGKFLRSEGRESVILIDGVEVRTRATVAFCPTEAMILAETERIKASWSRTERRRRIVYGDRLPVEVHQATVAFASARRGDHLIH